MLDGSVFLDASRSDLRLVVEGRILGLACFKGAEPFMHYSAGTVCSTISNTLAKGKPDVNLISTFERARHKWSSDKLIVTLPFKDFMTAMRSVDYSGYGKKAAT